MKNLKIGMTIMAIHLITISIAQQFTYKNKNIPVNDRVNDLLGRMSIDEKIAELSTCIDGRPIFDKKYFEDSSRVRKTFGLGIGMVNPRNKGVIEGVIESRNTIQNYLLKQTRLGIPTIFIDEAHHGLTATGASVFPQSIGLACSWDTALIAKLYSFVAKEASARGTNLVLAPVVDVCREPRWGRVGETFGEDPFLCGTFGSVIVQSFQGSKNGVIAPGHVAATLKHFAAHGQPEAGINHAPANYSERVIREFHLEPFRLCLKNSNPACVMASYNEIDGLPSHANKWLLTDVLREEFKFKGLLVSDWYGIDQLWKKHFVAEDIKEAALKAFKAGVTTDLPNGVNYKMLADLVKEGKISNAEIDSAVAMSLRLKFSLGLFEFHPIDIKKAKQISSDPVAEKLSLKAAEESMVLLKNDKNILPIKQGQFKKIAVIGPCASINYLGDYSGIPSKNVSILQGVKAKVGKTSEVLFSQGCKLSKNGDSISYNNFQFVDKLEAIPVAENEELIKKAVGVAMQADFIILAVGENEQFCREAWSPDHFGDNHSLSLPAQQEDLIREIAKTGKLFIVYLMHARPYILRSISNVAPCIIDGHYSGQQTGNAFANILFGDVCPSGKLTISYPDDEGHLPYYYNHKPSADFFNYVASEPKPFYPFGFGLSYTTFSYSDIKISATKFSRNEKIKASVIISNSGNVKGDEVVQLYIHDKVSSVSRPVKELKGFRRISLNAGESVTVSFDIDEDMLAFWNIDKKRVAEPGFFEIMIGPSSEELKKIEIQMIE